MTSELQSEAIVSVTCVVLMRKDTFVSSIKLSMALTFIRISSPNSCSLTAEVTPEATLVFRSTWVAISRKINETSFITEPIAYGDINVHDLCTLRRNTKQTS